MYGISKNLLIHESNFCLWFLSPKPVLPGHLIVLPKRKVQRLSELSLEESSNLWTEVQNMGKVLKATYECPALTLEFKDRTYDELFFNLIPRKAGDLASNDMIYPMLEEQLSVFDNEELGVEAERIKKGIEG